LPKNGELDPVEENYNQSQPGACRQISQEHKQMNRKLGKNAGTKQQDWNLHLEIVHPNAAGIDIGNESHYVAV
jgi:hypothetical protein